MKSSIILIPLDSRPVNSMLPGSIASMAGCRVVRPPLNILGNLNKPADIQSVVSWLKDKSENHPEAALVISADMLAYGGLIWSRKDAATLASARKNIFIFSRLKKQLPERNIYVFTTIPRDAKTVHGSGDFSEWQRQMAGVSASGNRARNRNLEIISELMEFAAAGSIDYLMVGKEDTAENNPFAAEIISIEKTIKKTIPTKAGIAAGADELACLLTARAVVKMNDCTPEISVAFSGVSPEFVPMYEPFPISKTVSAQVECAGAKLKKSGESGNHVIIHGDNKKEDVFLSQLNTKFSKTTSDKNVSSTIKIVKEKMKENITVGIADIRYMNGSSGALVDSLLKNKLYFKLGAYAGWNTSANSTGTVIAQMVASACGSEQKLKVSKQSELLLQRLAEDYIYSVNVREKIVSGIDNPTGTQSAKIKENVSNMVVAEMKEIENNSIGFACGSGSEKYRIKSLAVKKAGLPWGRIFELKTDCAVEVMKD